MGNEKIKILEMLKSGEITVDEANKLLELLKEEDEQGILSEKSKRKINDAKKSLSKKSGNLINSLKNYTKGIKKDLEMQKEFILDLPQDSFNLSLKALNGELVLKGHPQNKVSIKAIYSPKNMDNTISFDEKKYTIEFHEDDFNKVSIEVLVPIEKLNSININCTNCNYLISSINCLEIVCNTLYSNGIIEQIVANNISTQNMNGKMIFKNIKSENLFVINTDEYININNVDCENISVDSINAEINLANSKFAAFDEYKWDIKTINRAISLDIDDKNINYEIDAISTFGKINIFKQNLYYIQKSENIIKAETELKQDFFVNLKLNLKTEKATIILI